MSDEPQDQPTESFSPPREGLVWFSRFKFVRLLGRGGVGAVWEVTDLELSKQVALKVLPDVLRWDGNGMESLRNEVQRARDLGHPNIVRVFDLHFDAATVAISMELVRGRTLTQWRVSQPGGLADPVDILKWLPQLADALDYAHQQGVIHRDIKPANVLISDDGVVKIADFGVAARAAETMARVSSVSASGTLVYMSPQQLWGEPGTAADDIYSLGATLYELTCGEPPFVRGDLFAQVAKKLPGPLRQKSAVIAASKSIPKHWDRGVRDCLAKQAEDRPGTAAEVCRLLKGEREGRSSGMAALLHGRPRLFALIGLMVVSLAAAFFWNLRSKTTNSSDAQRLVEQVDLAPPSNQATAPSSTSESSGLAMSRNVFGSMAVELIGHFPFDGDAVNMVGNLAESTTSRVLWGEDRFGRKDAALKIGVGGTVSYPFAESFLREGKHQLAISAWMKVDGASARAVLFRPADHGALQVVVGIQRGMLVAGMGEYWGSESVECAMPLPEDGGEWFHFVVMVDDIEITLFLNGEKAGTRVMDRAESLPSSSNYALVLGHQQASLSARSDVLIDDFRVWRRRLDDDAVQSLWQESDPPIPNVIHADEFVFPWDKDRVYRSTEARYSREEDLPAVTRAELGSDAIPAEWNQIKVDAGPWPHFWAETSGIYRQSRSVTRDGSFSFSDRRNYEMTRIPGGLPRFFLAHAYIGQQAIALGSWTSTPPILATVPRQDRFTVKQWGGGSGDDWKSPGEADSPEAVLDYIPVEGASEEEMVRRYWIVDFPADSEAYLNFELALGDDVLLSVRRNRNRLWELTYSTGSEASEVSRNFVYGALPHRWIVVQSPSRVYQMVVETNRNTVLQTIETEPTPLAEVNDARWSFHVVAEEAGAIAIDKLPSVTHVLETP